jgi:hypothetical protein
MVAQLVEKFAEFCEAKRVLHRNPSVISDLSQMNPAHILSDFNGFLYMHPLSVDCAIDRTRSS